MKSPFLFVLVLGVLSASAYANYSSVCGEAREQGVEHAKVSLVYNDGRYRVFLDGKELADDAFAVTPDSDISVVTVFGPTRTSRSRKFEFTAQEPYRVQEFTVDSRALDERRVGGPLECIYSETEPSQEEAEEVTVN